MNSTSPGSSLGTARGSIIIDTSQPQAAVGTIRRVGRDMESSLGRVDVGAKKAESGLSRVSNTIGNLQTQIVGLGATSAILTGIGANMAGNLEVAEIRLKGMTGSLGAARALMDDLRKRAVDAGLPFADMLSLATRLLPTLNGNTKELDRYIGLARRVATLNMQEGLAGAAFSINEALTSGGTDLVSLVERFNVSRAQLRAELASNGGDFAAALDTVLTLMAITDQVADEMGQSFQAALRVGMDAAQQFLAAGLMPLLQTMTPLLQSGAAWLMQLQQTNPEVATLTSGLLAALAVAAPLAIAFNQMAEAAKTLKAAGVFGAAGRVARAAAPVALGIGIGGSLGIGAVRGVGAVTGEEKFQNYGLDTLMQDFKAFGDRLRRWDLELAQTIVDIRVTVQTGMIEVIALMIEGAQSAVNGIRSLIGMAPTDQGTQRANDLRSGVEVINRHLQATMNAEMLRRFPLSQAGEADNSGAAAAREAQAQANAEREQVIVDYYRGIDRIESNAQQQRLAQTEQYERQHAATVRQYNLTLAREEEDFREQRRRQEAQLQKQMLQIVTESARQRVKWEEDLQRTIAQARADSAERVAEWETDRDEQNAAAQRDSRERNAERETALEERLNKARADSMARITEMEANQLKERERAYTSHRRTLLTAAARLDAYAIFQEQKRFADEEKERQVAQTEAIAKERARLLEFEAEQDAAHRKALDEERKNLDERIGETNKSHDERVRDEQRSLDKSIAQQEAAHQRRLEEQAEADTLRLEEMKQNLRDQQAIEDSERATRLSRMAEDHQAQLNEMARAHGERMTQIDEQEAEELTAHETAHNARMTKLGEQLSAYQLAEDEFRRDALEKWKQHLKDLLDAIPTQHPSAADPYVDRPLPGFASGGPINRDMVAQLHGGEYVINAATTERLRGALGNFSQASLAGAVASGVQGGGGLSIGTVSPTIVLGDIGQHALPDVKRMVREGLKEALSQIAGRYRQQ